MLYYNMNGSLSWMYSYESGLLVRTHWLCELILAVEQKVKEELKTTLVQ